MIFVTGGRYQGRLKIALQVSGYSENDVFDFSKINQPGYADGDRDFKTSKIWYNLQEYVRALVLMGTEMDQIDEMVKRLVVTHGPEVIIMSEVGSGVIPMEKESNVFREAAGKLSVYFADEAKECYRAICGMSIQLK